MKNQVTKYIIAFCGLFYLIFAGCDGSSSESGPETDMVDSGSWYETGFTPWPHDGNPYESENFVIYSDAASINARQLLSQICEDAFLIIVEKLGLTDLSILRFPDYRNNKIHIYAYKNYTPTDWGGQAYYGGYLIYSPDHPEHTEWGHTALENYIPLVKHEMVHTVQTLIIGANDERLYSWFAEGIAIEISGDDFYTKIDSQAEFDDLISTWGSYNPISIHHSWTYPEIEGIGSAYLYPMFWLAVRYLTDPFGQGGTFYDVRDVIIDASNGVPFTTSLGNRFGISYTEYEIQFFDLMNDYLS
ncbi:MAG: hypothetical protein KJO26_12580 [Deltaproteobacteria bacterium]|nr:hypothetical protein [Deltaproteobacteria bacterium]